MHIKHFVQNFTIWINPHHLKMRFNIIRYAEEAKGPILEPMCGTGRFLIPLLKKGYAVTGFDYSPDMLNVCRKKCKELGLATSLLEATFETFLSN